MLAALEHMHKKNIIHRNLKPEAILLENKKSLKIACFGFSTVQETSKLDYYAGTKLYMSPERIQR